MQYPNGRLPAGLRDHAEPHPSFLYIEDSVGRVPLSEYGLLFRNGQILPTLANGCQEGVGIELAGFRSGCQGSMGWVPPKTNPERLVLRQAAFWTSLATHTRNQNSAVEVIRVNSY